jgi:hypothetical protein
MDEVVGSEDEILSCQRIAVTDPAKGIWIMTMRNKTMEVRRTGYCKGCLQTKDLCEFNLERFHVDGGRVTLLRRFDDASVTLDRHKSVLHLRLDYSGQDASGKPARHYTHDQRTPL